MFVREKVRLTRLSVGKTVRLLSRKNIPVIHHSNQAYIKVNKKTLEPTMMCLPVIHDDASDEFLDALQGFVDHEVGHILFTDSSVAVGLKKGVFFYFNAVEDIYIEAQMSAAYPGSKFNLLKTRERVIRIVYEPELQALLENPKTTLKQFWSLLVVPALRAMSGQVVYQEFMTDKWHLIAPVIDMIEPVRKALEKVRSTEDSKSIATKIYDLLKEPPKPPKPVTPPPKPAEPEESEEEELEEPEESEEEEPGEPGDPGESEEPEDESESEPSESGGDESEEPESSDEEPEPEEPDAGEKPEPEESDDEESDGESESSDDEGDESDGEESDGEESDGEPESDEDDSEPEDSDDDSDDEQEEEDEGDGWGDPDDGEESDSDSGGDEPGRPAPRDGDSDDSDEGEMSDSDGRDGSDGESGEDEDDPDMTEEDVPKPPSSVFGDEDEDLEPPEDSDESKTLSELAKEEHTESKRYIPFTTSHDRIEPFTKFNHDRARAAYPAMQATVDALTGPMRRHLERAFVSMNRSRWESGKRQGKLSKSSLYRLVSGDPRVFKKKDVQKTKDFAVSLVIDCSGSMYGTKIETAIVAAWALADVLSKLKLNFEIIGFTTPHEDALRDGGHSSDARAVYERFEALYCPIFKAFGEPFTTESKMRMIGITDGASLRQNIDGECVQIAGDRLLAQPEEGKAMIVLSDGAPYSETVVHTTLSRHLKQVVKDLEEKIKVVGIGIQTKAVKEYYRDHLVLNDAKDLPGVVVQQLGQLILSR